MFHYPSLVPISEGLFLVSSELSIFGLQKVANWFFKFNTVWGDWQESNAKTKTKFAMQWTASMFKPRDIITFLDKCMCILEPWECVMGMCIKYFVCEYHEEHFTPVVFQWSLLAQDLYFCIFPWNILQVGIYWLCQSLLYLLNTQTTSFFICAEHESDKKGKINHLSHDMYSITYHDQPQRLLHHSSLNFVSFHFLMS